VKIGIRSIWKTEARKSDAPTKKKKENKNNTYRRIRVEEKTNNRQTNEQTIKIVDQRH